MARKIKQPTPLTLDAITKKYKLNTTDTKVPVLFKYDFQELNDLFTGAGDKYASLIPGSGRGVPGGRIIEIIGPESSGKTTFSLESIKQYQAEHPDGTCAFIDFEHALDMEYASKLGVVWRDGKKGKRVRCVYAAPSTAEEGGDLLIDMVRSKEVGLIVVDSVAAMVQAAELAGNMGEAGLGRHAAHMSSLMRKVTPLLHDRCSIIFINQIRMKIGVMFGNPETTPGGNALKFYASVRLDIRRGKPIKKKNNVVGNMAKLRCFKNKVGVPNVACFLKHINGRGICGVTMSNPDHEID